MTENTPALPQVYVHLGASIGGPDAGLNFFAISGTFDVTPGMKTEDLIERARQDLEQQLRFDGRMYRRDHRLVIQSVSVLPALVSDIVAPRPTFEEGSS